MRKKTGDQIVEALGRLGDPPRPDRSNMAAAPRRRVRGLLVRWMRSRGWSWDTPPNGLRRRLYCLANEHHRWWDWGHGVMVLVGSDNGGTWDSPEPPTWWYRRVGPGHRMWRTGYPRRRVSDFEVIKDRKTYWAVVEGCKDADEMDRWSALSVDGDGELQLGGRYWGRGFYGMPRDEFVLLRRYLRMCHRHDWFGLRSWIYSQALHAAVHRRKPRSCGAVPPRGSGGYDHWHCEERRRHRGDHRYGAYVWPGGGSRVSHAPRSVP